MSCSGSKGCPTLDPRPAINPVERMLFLIIKTGKGFHKLDVVRDVVSSSNLVPWNATGVALPKVQTPLRKPRAQIGLPLLTTITMVLILMSVADQLYFRSKQHYLKGMVPKMWTTG